MNDITVLEGSRVDLLIHQGDEDSVSASLILKKEGNGQVITITDTFTDGVADVSLDGTQPAGVYSMQINENFATGAPDKYPDLENCSGDCELPTLTICASIDGVEVS